MSSRRPRQYKAPQVELTLTNGVNVITPRSCLIERVQEARRRRQQAVTTGPVSASNQLASTHPCIPEVMMGPGDSLAVQQLPPDVKFFECYVVESVSPSKFYGLYKVHLDEAGIIPKLMYFLGVFYRLNKDREEIRIRKPFPGKS